MSSAIHRISRALTAVLLLSLWMSAQQAAPPVGVDTAGPPQPATFELPPGAVLLAFSDGLVERRGEVIDTGLARLAATAGDDSRPLEDTLDRLLDQLTDPGVTDDTVLLGLRRDGVAVAPARSEEVLRSSR